MTAEPAVGALLTVVTLGVVVNFSEVIFENAGKKEVGESFKIIVYTVCTLIFGKMLIEFFRGWGGLLNTFWG